MPVIRRQTRFAFCVLCPPTLTGGNWQRATGNRQTGNRQLAIDWFMSTSSRVQLLEIEHRICSRSCSWSCSCINQNQTHLQQISPEATRLWSSQVISQANEDIASSSSSGLIEMLGSHLSTCGRSRRWSCFRTGCVGFGSQDEAIANLSASKALQSGSNQTIRRGQVRQSTLVTICKVARQEIRNSSACPYI